MAVKTPERTPPKMMPISSRPGIAIEEELAGAAEAGEGLGRVAAADGDDPGGDRQRERQQQAGDDAGGEEVGDGDAAAAGDRVDDHVVRRRQQQRDQRRHRGDVDRVVGAVAARLHLRDHDAADRRGLGDGRAGDAAEERRGGDVDLAEAAADVADQRAGEGDDAGGDAAADHQVAGEDEEGDRHQREDRDAGGDALEDDERRQAEVERRWRSSRCRGRRRSGVPISMSAVKTPKRIGQVHGVTRSLRMTSSAFGSWSTDDAGGAQHQPLEGEERHQHAAGDDRHVGEAARQVQHRDGRGPGLDGELAGRRPPCRGRRPAPRGRRSPASRAGAAGRKWTSTSKPMWKFSRTPTAAPRKMNQLITMTEAGSVQLGLAFST